MGRALYWLLGVFILGFEVELYRVLFGSSGTAELLSRGPYGRNAGVLPGLRTCPCDKDPHCLVYHARVC